MILGIGTDLCDIRRIERVLDRFGDRFLNRVFTDGECARARRGGSAAAALAERWAAKEACAKALGTGISEGVSWSEIEVCSLPSGQPCLRLAGGAERRLGGLLPEGWDARLHLSLAHEPPLAQASVVIEAVREGGTG